jgi:hypothetical protein
MVRARPAESTGALRSRQHEYAGKPQGASPIVFRSVGGSLRAKQEDRRRRPLPSQDSCSDPNPRRNTTAEMAHAPEYLLGISGASPIVLPT